jgi:uncharacterized protein (TIGR02996 family)
MRNLRGNMIQADTFLAEVLAFPAEDVPRLTFADSVEASDPDLATFIRAQCVIARPWSEETGECWQCNCARRGAQHTNGPCHCTAKWMTLRNLARELPTKPENFYRWAPPELCKKRSWANWSAIPMIELAPGFSQAVFRRGFIEGIRCTWEAWLLNADALTAQSPVRVVDLMTRPGVGWDSGPGRVDYLLEGRSAKVRQKAPLLTTFDSVPHLLKMEWPSISFGEPT